MFALLEVVAVFFFLKNGFFKGSARYSGTTWTKGTEGLPRN